LLLGAAFSLAGFYYNYKKFIGQFISNKTEAKILKRIWKYMTSFTAP
jgi:hypothetical protein